MGTYPYLLVNHSANQNRINGIWNVPRLTGGREHATFLGMLYVNKVSI